MIFIAQPIDLFGKKSIYYHDANTKSNSILILGYILCLSCGILNGFVITFVRIPKNIQYESNIIFFSSEKN